MAFTDQLTDQFTNQMAFGLGLDKADLYQRIQDFSLDTIDAVYPLSRRLSWENRWTLHYAQRVIEEYKKFVFLAVVAGHPVTPSEQIDQVWHLHLIYTRSYWDDFCPNVLGRSLHHGPTKGGQQENEKYLDWYEKTLDSYERIFGYPAPIDIWSSSDRRFGTDLQVKRVNVQQNWVIPKPDLSWLSFDLPHWNRNIILQNLRRLKSGMWAGMTIALVFGTSGCTAINPFEMTGSEFLTLYFWVGILVLTVGYIWRDWGRTEPEGNLARDLSPYELAYLNGKQARVVELAVTSLVKSNVITIEPGQPWTVVSPQPQVELDPIEKRVLNSIHSGIQLPQLRQQKCGRIESLRLQLQQNGLIVSEAKAQQIQSRSILLMGSFLSLGIVRLILGVMKGRPVGFLIMMMILFGLFGLGLWFAPKRTKKGDRAVKSAKARYAYIDPKKTSTIDLDKQVLLSAVAIYGGTVLLTDPALASLGRIMVPLSSSSSSDFGGGDSGGGCGGGGCGGGGCGG